jgi:hypothetical protein
VGVMAWLMLAACGVCGFTLLMTAVNLRRYRRPPDKPVPGEPPLVSVCIPARNEEANLEACVHSLQASDWPQHRLEVLLYDDHSTDGTARIITRLAATDPRVRVVPTTPLPPGWNGKQHACDRLGRSADGDWILFTDADVRFTPGAVRRAMSAALEPPERGAPDAPLGLVSTFPRQLMGTIGESLLVPMVFFLLMSYLPMGRMRRSLTPNASAGCGQFLLARRDAYFASGGHAAFPASMHDGVMLPRAVRRAGFRTDLFDGTQLCSVRMYHGFGAAWRGLAKNAYEGLGSIAPLVLLTLLHLVGHVLPWVVCPVALVAALAEGGNARLLSLAAVAGIAIKMNTMQRSWLGLRFRHSYWWCTPLHPVSVLLMICVQWRSLYLQLTGRRSWRGRTALGAEVTGTLAPGAAPVQHRAP